ncbi:protein FAM228B-like [Liolophura sinensis]|uniref:protein FAM228B-like n=1 Tax=Liolophura sinensis TaxID=3198878 RepID=UPI0031586F0F
MSSLLCVQQPGGTVHVYNRDVISQLSDWTSPLQTPASSASQLKSRSAGYTSSSSASRRDGSQSRSTLTTEKSEKLTDWLNAKSVKELQDRSDRETRSTRKLLATLLQGEKTFVQDATEYLGNRSILELRRKELLHKRWSDEVYEPLRKKINDEMSSRHWPDVDRRKREMHKQYLEFSNRKGHVFLDTIDPGEYYAMALTGQRPAPLKIATAKLRDPLLSQGSQRNDEDRMMLRCLTGNHYTDRDIEQIKQPLLPLVPLGRHGTECSTWLSMPLHNIESTCRQASRRRMVGSTRHQMDFGTWAKAPFDSAVVDEEMQVQRRRTFPESSIFGKPPPHVHPTHSQSHLVDVATSTSDM